MRFPCLLAVPLFSALTHAAVLDPANFTEANYVFTASAVTGMAWAPDGSNRLFVTRKGGEVRIVRNGALLPTPFATVSPVFTNSECGLIGFCFDPDFLNNQFVYFFVTVSAAEQQIIRYTDTANIGTGKTTLVSGLPTAGNNHDGGAVGIGPDGKLFWAIGDQGNGTGVDANLTSLASKIGRASRLTGAPCNDNPFFDSGGPNNDYIWARGFRNPFTFTFQPRTGNLWVNDVGTAWEQIFEVPRGSHGGWNDFENNQPDGFLKPLIAYVTNGTTAANIASAGAARNNGVVTITTTAFHFLRDGAKVAMAGMADPSFNGSFYVLDRLDDRHFTYLQSGPNQVSGGGTATTQNIGGAVTGGTFYDSTAFPPAYHGNFFFGDVNTGNIVRTTLDGPSSITSVDLFATGASQHIDAATGPDGALYYVGHPGQIKRVATTSTAQNIIVHPVAFDVVEGGSSLFTVRLARLPAADVTVQVAKIDGDPDVDFFGPSTLLFTPANWNMLQTVTIAAAEDADYASDASTFRVSATDLPSYDVVVNGIDNDEPRLLISAASVAFAEGATASFTISLASAPSGEITVTSVQSSGDSDIAVTAGATLTFTSENFPTPQTVTLAAAEDADNLADSAVISITLAGEPIRTVNANVTDNDPLAPAITTSPVTTAVVNAPYLYDVNATGNPLPTFGFPSAPPGGMTIVSATGVINWTPASTGSFPVTVRASNGVSPAANQSFTIQVNADAPPQAGLTSPTAGSVVSGADAEFFGDGIDDVRTVKAEFFVDGELRYTDVNGDGHYHFGGAHALWDTTSHTNGPHTVRFLVTDTIGQTAFAEAEVLIANRYAAWRREKFSPAEQADPQVSGLLADPDDDGVLNIVEYAVDSAPQSAAVDRLPRARVVNVGGQDFLALEFIRATWATDLAFTVEADDDLEGPWTPLSLSNQQFSLQNNTPAAGLQTIVIYDVVPLGTAGRRLMRLKIGEAP